jgi:hypothetical protein
MGSVLVVPFKSRSGSVTWAARGSGQLPAVSEQHIGYEENRALVESMGSCPRARGRCVSLPTERERLALAAAQQPAVHWDRLLFSAKESVFKAGHFRAEPLVP